jgi:hypothetical protein
MRRLYRTECEPPQPLLQRVPLVQMNPSHSPLKEIPFPGKTRFDFASQGKSLTPTLSKGEGEANPITTVPYF